MDQRYDIVILGGGIGGYTAAIRAAQLGKKVALVEKDKLGGTCLHRGCIPSKALLRSAEVYNTVLRSESYGISTSNPLLNFVKVQERKQEIVEQLHKGLLYLMNKNKIHVEYGNGRIIGPSIFSPKSGSVAVEKEDGDIVTIMADNLIIATGSRPKLLSGIEADGDLVMTSDEALIMEQLPKSILIIGGGVIGVEWASMLNDFGVDVSIVEYEQRLVPQEDEEISLELERLFKQRGIELKLGVKLLPGMNNEDGLVSVHGEFSGGQAEQIKLSAEKILISVGRQANVEGIGLENTGVKLERGAIKTNSFLQTAESHIYAVGDVSGGLQLAHVAAHEGIVAVEHLCGMESKPYESHLVPRCIYTRPEIASVGWTEEQALNQGFSFKVAKFPFKAIGKALVYGEKDGFVKVIADQDSQDILGVHMIGAHVTEHISEVALAQLLNATPWEVGQTIHPHPTLSEALGEVMLATEARALSI